MEKRILELLKYKNSIDTIEKQTGISMKDVPIMESIKPLFASIDISTELKIPYDNMLKVINNTQNIELTNEWNLFNDRYLANRLQKAYELNDSKTINQIEETKLKIMQKSNSIPDIKFVAYHGCKTCECKSCLSKRASTYEELIKE